MKKLLRINVSTLKATMEEVPDYLSRLGGRGLTSSQLGAVVLKTERAFNDAAGFTKEDDRLPAFFSEEVMTPAGFVFDVPEEEIDRVNRFE